MSDAPNAIPSERLAPLDAPGWGTFDRRGSAPAEPPRPDGDRWASLLGKAIVLAFSVGVAWATATAAVHQKVDKVEQVMTDARQDAQLGNVLEALRGLRVGIDSANLRLQQMACAGKPPSCR